MKIGMYSITYRGVWYAGAAVDVFSLVRLAKDQGWEGLELDTERPHAAPMDLSGDDRKRLRDLAGELELPLCAVSPNCDLSSPVPVQREAMICYVRECIKLAHSHFNAEFRRAADGSVELAAGGYFDDRFWQRRVAYPAYVEALIADGYEGYINWEFCHPAIENGRPAGIDYVHRQTALALEYMKDLRAKALSCSKTAVPQE